MSHTLAYGDIIRIFCSLQDNQNGQSKIGGFLMSKGFADANIYFLKSSKFTEFELRNSLFEILPYSSFEIHDEAKKKKEEWKKSKKGEKDQIEPENENTKSSKKTELEQFKSKIAKERKMEIRFDSEVVIKHVNSDAYLQGEFSCPETGIGSFKVILSDELSSDVKFKITRFRNSDKESEKIQSKDQFILYHCTSHCYLNIGNLGEQVFLDKEIKINASSSEEYNPSQLARQDNEAYKFYSQRPLIKQPNEGSSKLIVRYQVVNMSKPTLILKFLLEKSSRQQCKESEIQHNDVIYIRNTKNMSYLTADLWSGDIKLMSYLGQRSSDFPYQGIWEVSVPRDSEKGQFGNIKKYFLKHYITDRICKVEKIQRILNRYEQPQDYNQNHDRTNKTDRYDREQRMARLKRLKLDSKILNNANKDSVDQSYDTFKIINYSQKKTLNHRDLVFLEVCKSKDDSHTEADHTSTRREEDQNLSPLYLDIGNRTEKNYRTKLEEECAKNTENYSLQLTKGPLINAFQIFKLEEKKLKQINTLLSSVEILTNFCDILIVLDNIFRKQVKGKKLQKTISKETSHMKSHESFYQNPSSESNLMQNKMSLRSNRNSFSENRTDDPIESMLEKFLNEYLNYYILNLVISTIDYLLKNITKKNKKSDFSFMMMIKSLGLIEILIEAIFFIERNNEIAQASSNFKNKKYRKDRLDQCFKKVYQLLTKLSEENSCRLHLGKWFNMFMTQFYHLKKDFIHKLIIELLKEKFIIKTLQLSDIENCITRMKENIGTQNNFKYLQLLSSFCRAKNTAISVNQQHIINSLSKHPDIFYKFFKKDEKNAHNQTWRKQLNYYKQDEKQASQVYNKKDDKQKYIIFLLNLYSELIYDHPSNQIKQIEKFINMDTVKVFFIKKDNEKDNGIFEMGVIDSFLKLTHYFFQSKLNTSVNRIKTIDKEETLYQSRENKSEGEVDEDKERKESSLEWERFFMDYIEIIEFVKKQILQNQKNQNDYKISRLKTIETSLDFIRTVSRVNQSEVINDILKLIISVVIKLKANCIYEKATEKIMSLHNDYKHENNNQHEEDEEQQSRGKKKKLTKSELIDSIDKVIASNIQALLSQKQKERLLIDTRSIAGEILDTKINLLMNKALKKMNNFFIKVCDNKMNIEAYNQPRSSDTFVFGQNNYWIWINKIIDVVDVEINQNLNALTLQKHNNDGKKILVKLLIECIFVDSLKIVNKIVLLIFKLYELRRTLLYRFKDTFIIMKDHFINISHFNQIWISDFEKTKPTDFDRRDKIIKRLQILSFILRYYEEQNKMKFITQIYQPIMQSQTHLVSQFQKSHSEIEKEIDNESYAKLREGLSDYIVIDETQTDLSINQVLLQKMIGNQKIHTYVLNYIDTLKEDTKYYDEHLSIAYEFLTLLVYNNTKNKKILTKYIKVVLKHITTNYKAIEFMKKLIIENQNIINNRDIVSMIVKSIVEGAHSVSGDDDKLIIKAKLIESLRVFCILEGKSHVENQSLIMIKLQNRQYENTLMFSTLDYKSNKNIRKEGNQGVVNIVEELLNMGTENYKLRSFDAHLDIFEDECKESQQITDDFKKYPNLFQDFCNFRERYNELLEKQDIDENFMKEQTDSYEIEIPASIMCLAAYFSTMSALVEGNHEVNKGKCCNMHPYQSLVELVKDASKCWPLVRHMRSYIIKLYFSELNEKIEKKYGTGGTLGNISMRSGPSSSGGSAGSRQGVKQYEILLAKLFQKQIQLLIDRTKSANNDLLGSSSKISRIKIATPIRYQYLGAYLFCTLQEIIYEVNLFFEKIHECLSFNSDLRKRRPLNKDESDRLKELLLHIGYTYQLINKIKLDNPIKKILDNILLRSFTVAEMININQDPKFEFLDTSEQTSKIKNIMESFPILKDKAKDEEQKKLHNKFIVHIFYLSNQQSRQSQVYNANPYQLFHLNKISYPDTNIKRSYIRRLIPIPAQKESNKNSNDLYEINMRKADMIYEQLQNQDKQIRINRLLQIISEDLVDRKESEDIIKEEMDDLVKLCCDLDQTHISSSADPNQPVEYRVVGYKKFMENIIHLVTKSPVHLTLEGKIKTIRLIRLIFQEKVTTNCKLKQSKYKEWQSGMFQDAKLKELEKIQKQFKDLKLNQMIVAILKSEVESYELLSETFKLGVRFLYNGNSQCQYAVLGNLQEDPENMVMVALFSFIKKIRLQISQGKFVIKSKDEKRLQSNNFSDYMIDTFHHFDAKQKMMNQLGAQKDNSKQFEQDILIKIQCVCEAYQFLQLMCENDNQICKNFLREQTNQNGVTKYNSINFVSETAKLFKVVLDNFNSESKHYNILRYLADFFIEVTQLPCTLNQFELCSTSIFSDIKYEIIKKEKDPDKVQLKSNIKTGVGRPINSKFGNKFEKYAGSDKPMCYLMDFVVNAGLSLLEGGSKEIYESLISTFDGQFIYEIFKYHAEVLNIENKKHPQCPQIHQFNDDTLKIMLTTDSQNAEIRKRIHMIYNLFALVLKLSKYTIEQSKQDSKPAVTLLQKLKKHVEGVEKIKKETHFEDISKKEELHSSVIADFPSKLKHIEVVFDSNKQYLYFPNLPIFQQLSEQTQLEIVENIKRDTQIDKITDFLVKSPQINHLMDWNFKVEDRLSLKTQTLELIRFNILILTTVIIGLYILFTSIVFVEVKGKMQMLKSIDNPIINGIVNILCVFHLFFSVYFVFTWCTLKYRMPIERQLKQKGDDNIKKLLQKIDNDEPFDYHDVIQCLKLMFKNQNQIYSILFFFILFSFMGYFVGHEWYSMLIFDIVTRNKILKSVIQAITSNLRQLLVVSILILAFVYVFNMLSIQYNLYLPLIYQNQQEKCTILSDCVISLYTSGEIGEKHKDFKFTKFIADLLYIVIMELLFSNIVSGIVIDTFAQLRDQRKTIESDNKTKCFICGISKGTLEKQLREEEDPNLKHQSGMNKFNEHTTMVHYQWDYIYYLYILSKKDITTYTGIEYYIKKQCSEDQYDWIPTHEEDDDKEIKEILETTQRLIPRIKDKLQSKNEFEN